VDIDTAAYIRPPMAIRTTYAMVRLSIMLPSLTPKRSQSVPKACRERSPSRVRRHNPRAWGAAATMSDMTPTHTRQPNGPPPDSIKMPIAAWDFMAWQIDKGQVLSQDLQAAVTEFIGQHHGADGSAELEAKMKSCMNTFNDKLLKELHACIGW
jgi:hypothetical protein